jgi:hypothetical protein
VGLRYRKSFKIAPGLKLNLNAKSASITGGVRGAHVTYNSKGYRTASAGVPGTGLSYRATKRVGQPAHGTAPAARTQSGAEIVANLLKAIVKLIFFGILGCVITQVLTGHWWIFLIVVVAAAALMRLRSVR